jgi:hypothetical protein
MISVAERGVRAQRVHTESLGEKEQKRSYRRDTVVLALPEWVTKVSEEGMGREHGRAQTEVSRNGARPMLSHQVMLTADQRYGDG